MEVKVLGAANEVGRSGFLVNCDGTNLLLDYGVLFGKRGTPPEYPLHVKPKDLDAIIITHAHLDHSGNVPSLFVSGNTDVYATPPTFDLTRLLIEDMLKITKDAQPFGLPELNKNEIKNGRKIANPGCYATSIILGTAPFKGKIKNILVSSISGISGAGMEVQEEDNFLVYKEGVAHPQIQEIKSILGLNDILFVPQRIDTAFKGIISNIFVKYESNEDIINLYKEFYKNCQFVRIREANENIETKNVNGTNFCDIKVIKNSDTIIIISALDNLMKGGAGQAVQNMNIMYGFNETEGLLSN